MRGLIQNVQEALAVVACCKRLAMDWKSYCVVTDHGAHRALIEEALKLDDIPPDGIVFTLDCFPGMSPILSERYSCSHVHHAFQITKLNTLYFHLSTLNRSGCCPTYSRRVLC